MQELPILLLTGVSIGLLLWTILTRKKEEKSISSPEENFSSEKAPAYLQLLRPMARGLAKSSRNYARQTLESDPESRSFFIRYREQLQKSLVSAGSPGGFTSDELLAISLINGFVITMITAAFCLIMEYPLWQCSLVASLFGIFLPILWLNGRKRSRQVAIQKDLPYLLDLMTLCIEAGLDFTTALARIVPSFSSTAIGYEMNILLREVQMGRSRSESLKGMSKRVGLAEMSTVVNAINQADQMGTSIGPCLRIQSEESRVRRSMRAEEMAMKTPVKLLFPLVAFIFPTTFIVIFGPVIIRSLPMLSSISH